ncbi:MAG: o-succinylbenzoate synthase [Micrococcaceae bacterium]
MVDSVVPELPAPPPLEELLAEAVVVGLPMNTRFRGTTLRQVMLLRGPRGWAEFSPFPEYDAVESSRWLAAAVEAGWQGWPAGVRDWIPVNATVPAVAAQDVPEVLARYGESISAVKIKVAESGQQLSDDLDRVAAVRDALPDAGLRIDANAGWDHDTALEALSRIAEITELEYAEQPVPGIEGLARLREALAARGIETRLAADEAIRKETDPLAVARAGAADLAVVKVQPLGGVRRALGIVEAAGLDAVVSSALDSSVGLAGGVALAAALPELPFACGLGTAALFADDVVVEPWIPRGGGIAVRPAPEPDVGALERLRLPEETQRWWRERLTAAHTVLAGGHRQETGPVRP